MKITEAQSTVAHVPAAASSTTNGAIDAVESPSPVVPIDRITTDEAVSFRASVSNGVNMAAKERAVRLQSLAEAVRAGAYRPMASDLAEQILAQAELEARLATYLG